MTDLDFDADSKGRLVRGSKLVLTAAEHDAVAARATTQGVTQAAVVRAAVRRALATGPDPLALEAEQEVTTRRKVGAHKTNSKR
jgi:hypothetical protein